MAKVVLALIAWGFAIGQTPSSSSLDLTEIWKAALRQRSGSRSLPVMVMNETARACGVPPSFPCFTTPQTTQVQLNLPKDLGRRLTEVVNDRTQQVSGLTAGALPISRAELEPWLHPDGANQDFWRAFYHRYANTSGFLILSNPAFDDAEERAVLLMDHYYGTLGAVGKLLLLERNRALGGEAAYWRVTQSWTLWES